MNFSFTREMEGIGVCLDARVLLTRILSSVLLQGEGFPGGDRDSVGDRTEPTVMWTR